MILSDKLKEWRLVLASGSPRRSALMEECGLNFTVADKYGVKEKYPADMPPADVPLFLAHLKSDAYPVALTDRDILITADTIVILDDQILGKPSGREDAIEMLGRLSGCTHTVVSGVVLRGVAGRYSFSCATQVTFARLTEEQIEHYVDLYAPFDKAGSYAIQEWIGYVGIERIEGSYYNVMGLPTRELCAALEAFVDGDGLTLL